MKARKIWAFVLLGLLLPGTVLAAVPELLSYQGRLTDRSGNPVNGAVSIKFAIYDAASGGTALWHENQSVTAVNGVYNVLLGSATAFPADLFDSADRYLGVTVGADSECSPRQRMASSPFAIKAAKAEDADTVDGLHADQLAYGGQVGLLRHLLAEDRTGDLLRYEYASNWYVDGFNSVSMLSSIAGYAYQSQGRYLWTSASGAILQTKPWSFPSLLRSVAVVLDSTFYQTYDEFEDGSVSLGAWNVYSSGNASVTEHDGSMEVRCNGTTTGGHYASAAAKTPVLSDASRWVALSVSVYQDTATTDYHSCNVMSSEATCALELTNGTSVAAIDTIRTVGQSQSGALNGNYDYEFQYNPTAGIVIVYRNGAYLRTTDVASLGSSLLIKAWSSAVAQGSGGCFAPANAIMNLHFVRFEKSSSTSGIRTEVSANGGTDWTLVEPGVESSLAVPGSSFVMRHTPTLATGEYLHIRGHAAFLR